MAAGLGAKPIPLTAADSTVSARPPATKPNPVTVSSSSPGTGLAPTIVIAANPPPASTAMPAPASTVLSATPPPGTPTSSARLASATQVAVPASQPGRRRHRTASVACTMTGTLPIATRVARLTEVSITAVK